MKVLLVGDNEHLLNTIGELLASSHISVKVGKTFAQAATLFWSWKPQVVVAELPFWGEGAEKWELIRKLKEIAPVRIIALVESGKIEERIRALEWGADDAVFKSSSPREVVVRVKALLRRMGTGAPMPRAEIYTDGFLLVNFSTQELFLGGHLIKLSRKEFAVLECLARHPRQILSPRKIADLLSPDYTPELVRHYIFKLRRKLEPDPSNPIRIKCVRGLGYYLDNPDKPFSPF
ncbi:MAG: response regulator transcription factor [Anaerolineae bacterium]|nr:response regulator transcription factor [Anaerolineae bacterium]MDW8102824.1 response regulator transcription factor [Anaerolineae bacterium]